MAVSLAFRTHLRNKLHLWINSTLGRKNLNNVVFPARVKFQRNFSDESEWESLNAGKNFHHSSLKPPEGVPCYVFRKFSTPDEQLGPGADPNGDYKNPEYYSYHKNSFADFLVSIIEIRNNRKEKSSLKCLYECEQTDNTGETQEAIDERSCKEISILPEGEGKACGDPALADECGLIEREEASDCTEEKHTKSFVDEAPKEKLKTKKKCKKVKKDKKKKKKKK